jgi:hypothetical protein
MTISFNSHFVDIFQFPLYSTDLCFESFRMSAIDELILTALFLIFLVMKRRNKDLT